MSNSGNFNWTVINSFRANGDKIADNPCDLPERTGHAPAVSLVE